jgi:aminopeptidase N
MARDIADEMEWMASILGPPPQKLLSVSPIPGNFGQGFPGLLYLSTMAYLQPPAGFGAAPQQTYFSELLHAHETAHQWWGNSIVSPGYEDDWIQEAFANYMALMALERRRGAKAMDKVLEEFRQRLIAKDADGQTAESAGPVTFGLRLQNSRNFAAWRTIVYDKGAWIAHMLRRRLGDALFTAMLTEAAARYRERPMSTEDLRALAAEFLARQPAGPSSYRSVDPQFQTFFDTWTAGTGVPSYVLKWSVRGAAPKVVVTATVTQTGAGEDFMDAIPVEFHTPRGRPVVRWIRTTAEPATVVQTLAVRPSRVLLDPGHATLKQ